MNQTQKDFPRKALDAIKEIKLAHERLEKLWSEGENSVGIDLNDYIVEDFPFNESFDEIDIGTWLESSTSYINSVIGVEG